MEGGRHCAGGPASGGGAPRRRRPCSAWVDCWGCRQQHAQDLQELAREAEERLIEARRGAAEDAQVRITHQAICEHILFTHVLVGMPPAVQMPCAPCCRRDGILLLLGSVNYCNAEGKRGLYWRRDADRWQSYTKGS